MFPSVFLVIVLMLVLSTSAHMRITGLVVALTLPAGALSSLAVVFQLKVRNDVNVLIVTLNSVLWTSAVLFLSLNGAGLLPFAIAFSLIALLTASLQSALAFRHASIDLSGGRALTRKLIKLSIPVGLFGLAVTAYNRLDLLLVFGIAGSRDAGFYSAVYRIVDQAGFVPGTFAVTITPILAMSYRTDLERVRRLLQAAADHVSVVSFGGLGFAIVAGAPLLAALYGPEFAQAAPAFALLMGNYVIICFATVFGTMVVTLNLQRKLVPYALITVAFNLSLNLIVIPLFGYIGAAAVSVATETLILLLTVRLLQPHLHLRPRLDRIARVAVAAVVMSVCVWLLRQAGAGLAALMLSSLAIYLPLLFILRAVQIDDLRSMLRAEAAL
jgi:O-antigen/teichoic acid export membrane protein